MIILFANLGTRGKTVDQYFSCHGLNFNMWLVISIGLGYQIIHNTCSFILRKLSFGLFLNNFQMRHNLRSSATITRNACL